MKDGFEMEEKLRKLTEKNLSLEEQLSDIKEKYEEHRCNTTSQINDMQK